MGWSHTLFDFFKSLFSHDSAIATVLLGAVFTLIINARLQRRLANRQQTFLLLSRIFEGGPVGEARIAMAKWVAQDKEFIDDNVSDEEDKIILSILDFYEFVCEGALASKTVDLKILNQESGGRIERYYLLTKNYITYREKTLSAYNASHGLKEVLLYMHIKKFLKEVRNCDI